MPRTYTSTIVEKIGDLHYMFNWSHLSTIICDDNYTSGLRCYQDTALGLYSTGIVDSCDYVFEWVGILEAEMQSSIKVFPNPAQDYVDISIDRFSKFRAELYDVNGRIHLETKSFISNTRIDLSKIGNGIYVIVVFEKDKKVGYKRIMKN